MRIDDAEVRHIAALANLELTDQERVRFGGQLSAILDYIDQLQAYALPPPSQPVVMSSTALADDIPSPSLPRELVERNAPAFEHGHFVVPKIIGGE